MRLNISTTKTVYCALLIALSVFLGGALKIPAFLFGTYSLKLSFGALPVILSGVLFGPIYGGIVGGLADILQATLFPVGAYQPWFTITGILFGLIPGLFFMKRQKPAIMYLLACVSCTQIISSVICNTLLIAYLYNLPLWGILPARLLTQAVMIPLFAFLLKAIINLPPIRGMIGD